MIRLADAQKASHDFTGSRVVFPRKHNFAFKQGNGLKITGPHKYFRVYLDGVFGRSAGAPW